jgi:hypothetical protein
MNRFAAGGLALAAFDVYEAIVQRALSRKRR